MTYIQPYVGAVVVVVVVVVFDAAFAVVVVVLYFPVYKAALTAAGEAPAHPPIFAARLIFSPSYVCMLFLCFS